MFAVIASLGLSLSPVLANSTRAEEPSAEATTQIDITGQLIELSNTSIPTVIVVRQNPTGEFTDYTVDITSETKLGSFRWNTSPLDEWMTGDTVRIMGDKNENTGVVAANLAMNQSINPTIHRGLNGWITDIDGEAKTLTVQWMNEEHTVHITDDTNLVISPNTNANLTDFAIGDRVRIRMSNDGENQARFVVALRRGDILFLKARTRPFAAEVNTININADGTGSMQVTMGENKHLLPGDVNNLFGVEGDIKTVIFDENTKFVRRFLGTSAASEIQPGDKLYIVGRANDDSTISARLIKDSNLWMISTNIRAVTVSAIDTTTNTITISGTSLLGITRESTVSYNDETEITQNGQPATENDIQAGDKIRLQGLVHGTEEHEVSVSNATKIDIE